MTALWYAVRIDRDEVHEGRFVFKVEPSDTQDDSPELVGLDSVPGIVAIVKAESPGHAAARAWDKALEEMRGVTAAVVAEEWSRHTERDLITAIFRAAGLPAPTPNPEDCPDCHGSRVCRHCAKLPGDWASPGSRARPAGAQLSARRESFGDGSDQACPRLRLCELPCEHSGSHPRAVRGPRRRARSGRLRSDAHRLARRQRAHPQAPHGAPQLSSEGEKPTMAKSAWHRLAAKLKAERDAARRESARLRQQHDAEVALRRETWDRQTYRQTELLAQPPPRRRNPVRGHSD